MFRSCSTAPMCARRSVMASVGRWLRRWASRLAASDGSGGAPNGPPPVIGLDHQARAAESRVGSRVGPTSPFGESGGGVDVPLTANVLFDQAALLLPGPIDDQGFALGQAAMLRVVAGHSGAQVRLQRQERT